ncbi:MAG: triose-phosphate isomerase [Coriobacteriia bacterium]|nr:triose-phosphate isomerase [Coriobacteriia bacterium]
MSRKKILLANWKMNTNYNEAVTLAQEMDYERKAFAGIDTVVCPPYISLKGVGNVFAFDKSPLMLGAQDVFWEQDGAYTGFISASMLKSLAVSYCIVGHSERRHHAKEDDKTVGLKAQALLEAGITPVICVGEPPVVYEAGSTREFVSEQLSVALEQVEDPQNLVVAYEPIWAIGSGKVASPLHVQEVLSALRAVLEARFGAERAEAMRLVYGGSVMAENIHAYSEIEELDGFLVGGASLDAQKFAAIAKNMK